MNRSVDRYGDYSIPATQSEDMFDFVGTIESLVNAIRLNLGIVLITTAIVIGCAALYHYVWPPVYKVEAAITVERTDDAQRDAFYREWNLFRKEDARTEIELMKSGAVLMAVIKKEGLRYDDVYHPFMSQISYFWNESWPGRAYRSFKDWIFGTEPLALTEEEKELGLTIRDMQAGFSVQTSGDVLVGIVQAKGPSPRIASITNTWLDEYQSWRSEQHLTEARRSVEALGQEIAKAQTELDKLDTESKRREIVESKERLERDLGVTVKGFRAPTWSRTRKCGMGS